MDHVLESKAQMHTTAALLDKKMQGDRAIAKTTWENKQKLGQF
jgi:hypothetical protein